MDKRMKRLNQSTTKLDLLIFGTVYKITTYVNPLGFLILKALRSDSSGNVV